MYTKIIQRIASVFSRHRTSVTSSRPRFQVSDPEGQRQDADLFEMQQVLGRTRDRLWIEQKRLAKQLTETHPGQTDASQRISTKIQQTIVERQQVASDISRIQRHLRGGTSVLIEDTAASNASLSAAKGPRRELIIAALTAHHQYKDGSVANRNPVGLNAFARRIGVAPATVSKFLKLEVKGKSTATGYQRYVSTCRSSAGLINTFKLWNNEFPAHILLDRVSGEGRDMSDSD